MSNFYTGKNVMEAINAISTSDDNAKEIRITPPEGYEIDKENSTFECIQFKPIVKRWREGNWVVSGYHNMSSYPNAQSVKDTGEWMEKPIFATEKQAKSALAMARISQIMANDERFGGVITDEEWQEDIKKYTIDRKDNCIIQSLNIFCYKFLAFHTEKQRDLFFKENEDLVKDYLMLEIED